MSKSEYPKAFVTLITSDSYLPGALALAQSLKASGTRYPRVALFTAETTCSATVQSLYQAFDRVIAVPLLRSNQPNELALLGRTELDVTWTKLYCWDADLLWPYESVAFLDADTIILKNIDDIFDYVHNTHSTESSDFYADEQAYRTRRAVFAAAPDIGWPDCFNSGVFVLKPDKDMYQRLLQFAMQRGSFDGGDQGLLNAFFNTWASGEQRQNVPMSSRLPFLYNVTPSGTYSYLPAYEHYYHQVKLVHFIGHVKPWHYDRFEDGSVIPRASVPNQTLHMVQRWWSFYDQYQHEAQSKPQKKKTTEFQRHFPATTKRDAPFLVHPAFADKVKPQRPATSTSSFRPSSSSSRSHRSTSPHKPLASHHLPHKPTTTLSQPIKAIPSPSAPSSEHSSPKMKPQAPNHDFGTYRIDWDERDFTRKSSRASGSVTPSERDEHEEQEEQEWLEQEERMVEYECNDMSDVELKEYRKMGIKELRKKATLDHPITEPWMDPCHEEFSSQSPMDTSTQSGGSTPKLKATSTFGIGGTNFILDTTHVESSGGITHSYTGTNLSSLAGTTRIQTSRRSSSPTHMESGSSSGSPPKLGNNAIASTSNASSSKSSPTKDTLRIGQVLVPDVRLPSLDFKKSAEQLKWLYLKHVDIPSPCIITEESVMQEFPVAAEPEMSVTLEKDDIKESSQEQSELHEKTEETVLESVVDTTCTALEDSVSIQSPSASEPQDLETRPVDAISMAAEKEHAKAEQLVMELVKQNAIADQDVLQANVSTGKSRVFHLF